MNNKISKETITRTCILILALINNVLTMLNLNPLPFSNDQVYEVVSVLFTVGASVWAWWKNNSFTQSAIKADEYMKELKKSEKVDNDVSTKE